MSIFSITSCNRKDDNTQITSFTEVSSLGVSIEDKSSINATSIKETTSTESLTSSSNSLDNTTSASSEASELSQESSDNSFSCPTSSNKNIIEDSKGYGEFY